MAQEETLKVEEERNQISKKTNELIEKSKQENTQQQKVLSDLKEEVKRIEETKPATFLGVVMGVVVVVIKAYVASNTGFVITF